LVALAVLVVGAGFAMQTKQRPVPAQTPGYQVISVAAPHRTAPLEVHVWYPTDATDAPALIAQNGLFYGFYAKTGAAPSAGAHPLVLLSHGSGGNAAALGWIATALADQGMIVAAPNHPGTMSRDSDPFQTIAVWNRPLDLTAVLDALEGGAIPGLSVDPARVGNLGFSLGGYSVLGQAGALVTKEAFIAYCTAHPDGDDCAWMTKAGVDFTTIDAAKYDASHTDPRIMTTVAVDPALSQAMTSASLATMNHPVLVINLGDADKVPVAMRADQIVNDLPQGTHSFVPGSHHFSFLAECSTLGRVIIGLAGDDNICSDSGLRDRGEVHTALIDTIGGFFRKAFDL
jgi:predicted dienelactone hydrolase